MIRCMIAGLLGAVLGLMVPGCTSVDSQQQLEQEKLLAEADREVGLPKITNFTEKKLLAKLYELRDQAALPTWTYYLDMHGKRHFACRSIGFGLPYATQFSNPMKWVSNGAAHHSLPQAEPNGVFVPASADGTWVMRVTAHGPEPTYFEPKIVQTLSPWTEADDAELGKDLYPEKK